ncbi:MAG TPA: carboxypeptidase regulatory-like domain-containing protein [Burkholderiales bacterium]|nr:carboxypeptidase regulatory-like domain-containing protein [Burkholderiales bacterium]
MLKNPRQEGQQADATVSQDSAGTRKDRRKTDKRGCSEWKSMKDWVCERPWPVVLFGLLFGIAWIGWATDACSDHGIPEILLPLLMLAWVGALFAWFIVCFAGDAYLNRLRAIEFAYFFMVLSFCLVGVMITDMGKARKFGVVEGCIENLAPNNVSLIQCDYPIRAPWRIVDAAKKDKEKSVAAPAEADTATAVQTPAPAQAAARDAAKAKSGIESNGMPTIDELKDYYAANRNYHYLLNIGGRLTPLEQARYEEIKLGGNNKRAQCNAPVYAVRGGLPVPVYFIVLALIGGAISLAKNVPVIHKRSDEAWQGTVTEPRLAPGEVRELLLFQVLQFVSAPLLAVAAYHTIKPDSFGTTVALGFLVGFASDQILASIRGMIKSQPLGSAMQTPLAGSIKGAVTQGDKPVQNATVVLLSTTLNAKTDDKGGFLLTAVPTKSDPYTLRVTAADKSKEVPVTVKDPAQVTVQIALA